MPFVSRLALIALFFAGLPSLAGGPVWPIADFPRFWLLGEGSGHIAFDGSFLYTKENYDQQGQVSRPARLDNVTERRLRVHAGYGFAPKVSLFAQADLRGVFVKNLKDSNVPDEDNYGVGDAFLGLRWLFHHSGNSSRYYPTEWSPETYAFVFEGTWLFPTYDKAPGGKPPIGDQSNDATALLRFVWYTNEWLAFSAYAGYTYRTANYAAELPWSIRGDFMFMENQRFRLWTEFSAKESLANTGLVLNPTQLDVIPSGSLLFKSREPVLRFFTLGGGFLLSKTWEAALAAQLSTGGRNAAKSTAAIASLAWRPYQVKEVRYEHYRREERQRVAAQPRTIPTTVLKYGFRATILRVSHAQNFFRIAYGKSNSVKVGEMFQVFEPENFDGTERAPVALATVAVVNDNASFLRVIQRYRSDVQIVPGFEAQRVTME